MHSKLLEHTDLPYFLHVLELLVHEVLEEEATSKEPIPDALLPRVVAFVEEFPEYLQTIAHCARKSDVAVWQYFFSVVGNPIDLFQECLSSNRLHTAASYLIILQNLEKHSMARQHATMLLDAALEQCSWDLARELIRFLTAIDPSYDEVDVPATRRQRQSSTSVYPALYPSPPVSPEDTDPFMYHTSAAAAAVRGRSVGKDDPAKDVTKIKDKYIRHGSLPAAKSRHLSGPSCKDPTHDSGSDKVYVETVLNRHAQKLLSAFRLHDLAFFAANLQDYELVGWLRKERLHSARIDDFVGALKQLHVDFHWPFPVLSLSALQHVASATSIESQSSVTDQIGCLRLGKLDVPGAQGTSTPLSGQSSVSAELCTQSQEDSSASGGVGTLERSEDSGSFLGGEADSIDSSGWSDTAGMSDMDQITAELANRGPQKSDLKLRYLFQLLMEAGCLEWAMLVCVILRDAVLFLRVINLACLADTPPEVIIRLQSGLALLEQWVGTDCPGYRPFFQAVQCHVAELRKCPTTSPSTVRGAANVQRSNSVVQQADGSSATSSVTPASVESTPTLPRLDSKGDRWPEVDSAYETSVESRTESDSRCVVS